MINVNKGTHMKNFVLSGGIILNLPSFEKLSIAARSFSFSLGLVAVIAVPSAVFANDNDMEEIVVTARMVEESLQDVPVTVTSIGEETLDAFRIDDAVDLVSRIPALNIAIGASGQSGSMNLRGVGTSAISNAFDSAVALNYDGISVSTQRLLQAAFFDVEQIDLLKGPQSLFFGKAASAGVLSFRSASPTPEWEYGVTTSYEFEEEGTTVGGYISGPLNDTLGIRIAAEVQNVDKWVEIAPGNPTTRPDRGIDNVMARVSFKWEPNENLVANLKLDYNSQEADILQSHQDIFCGGDGQPDPAVLLGGALGSIPGIDLFLPTHDCNISDGLFVGIDGHPLINTIPTGSAGAGRNISEAFNDTDTFFARLQLDYTLSENLGLTFLAGYIDLDNEYNDIFSNTGQLPDGSPAGLVAPFRNTLEQFTAELRLASSNDGPFNFQVGAFVETREMGHDATQNAFNPSLLGAFAPIFGPTFGPDPATGFTFDWLAVRPIEADAVSLFVSAQYDLTENLELAGGVRWTDEEKSTSIGFPFIHAGVAALGLTPIASGFQGSDVEFEDDNISPEISLTYAVSDDITIYGAYKTGFKSGGIDNNSLPTGGLVVNLESQDPAVRQSSIDVLQYESEESDGGEIGLKARLLDRSLTLNITAFRYVFENLQAQIFDPAVFAFSTFNAGEVTTQGIDVDFIWRTSVPGVSLVGAWSFLDTEITGDLFVPSGANLKGRQGSFAPDMSGNIAINWETSLNDSLMLSLSHNIAYKDDYFVGGGSLEPFDAVTNPFGDIGQDSYTTIDVNLSIFAVDESWRVSLIATNLTDEEYITYAGPAPFRPATGDDQLVGFNRGRQVFVEAAFKF